MQTAEARATPEELDAIQLAVGRVPLRDFRLKDTCATCRVMAQLPVTFETIYDLRLHLLTTHISEVILPKCPDDGTCHHDCATFCFRVACCGPLSGAFPNDEWPKQAGPKY